MALDSGLDLYDRVISLRAITSFTRRDGDSKRGQLLRRSDGSSPDAHANADEYALTDGDAGAADEYAHQHADGDIDAAADEYADPHTDSVADED